MTTTIIFGAVLVTTNVLIGFACFALGMKTGINMQMAEKAAIQGDGK